jgi:hypothetical protein
MVGQTRIESVAREPAPQIPDFFELVGNCLKCCSAFGTEKADDIFQDKPSRPCFFSELNKVVEESTPFTFEAFARGVCVGEVLTRPTSCPDFCLGDVFGFKRGDVAMNGYLWPMSAQNLLAMWIDFTMKNRLNACSLESKVEASDSSKEGGKPKLLH